MFIFVSAVLVAFIDTADFFCSSKEQLTHTKRAVGARLT